MHECNPAVSEKKPSLEVLKNLEKFHKYYTPISWLNAVTIPRKAGPILPPPPPTKNLNRISNRIKTTVAWSNYREFRPLSFSLLLFRTQGEDPPQ